MEHALVAVQKGHAQASFIKGTREKSSQCRPVISNFSIIARIIDLVIELGEDSCDDKGLG